MATKKVNYSEKSDKDIDVLIGEKREALREFRFGSAGSKTRNVKEGKALRKEIARLLTETNKRKAKA